MATLFERQRSLMSAGKYRRTRLMVAVAPAGTTDLSECPDRADFPTGAAGELKVQAISKCRVSSEW